MVFVQKKLKKKEVQIAVELKNVFKKLTNFNCEFEDENFKFLWEFFLSWRRLTLLSFACVRRGRVTSSFFFDFIDWQKMGHKIRPKLIRTKLIRPKLIRTKLIRPKLIRLKRISPKLARPKLIRPKLKRPNLTRPKQLRLKQSINKKFMSFFIGRKWATNKC